MAKVAQKMKQAEITEQDSLLLTRNLLRIAIFNISYIRGLFPENYFNDKDVSALDMKVKKLMPIDDDSRRLIDWMEKGVYDALQKKYLKTLLFCICESVEGSMIEEYAFSFTYSSSDNEEVSMNINRRGNKKNGATFKSNSNEITPEQMRFSACKMVRTLIQLMRTLDQMPDERTILMKLLYYDDVTPEDYEPPFFRKGSDSESNNTWKKDPLKMDVGNINSKHLVLSLKVKSILDPCEDENDNSKDDDEMSMGTALEHEAASESDDDQSQENQYIVEPVGNRPRNDDNSMADDDDTQDAEIEEENTTRLRNWICSRHVNDVALKDILTNFPDISLVLTEEIVGKLVKEGLISNSGGDSYTINREKDINRDTYVVKEENDMDFNDKMEKIYKSDNDDYMYTKALYHTLPMDYVTVSKLHSKLEGEANQATVRKLIKKMENDGFIKSKGFRKLGKPVIHSEFTNNKLSEIKKQLENKTTAKEINDRTLEFNRMDFTHSHGSIPRNGSTCATLHSFGSEFTRTRVLSDTLLNVSLQNGQPSGSNSQYKANTPTSKPEPISSLESGVNGIEKTRDHDRIPPEADVSVRTRSTLDKRIRKIDRVSNPILQYVKRQKNKMA